MSSIPLNTMHHPPRNRSLLLAKLLFVAALAMAFFNPTTARAQVYGSIALWPENNSLEVGSSRQFGAYVPITPNTVTWLVNDIPGGNATLGTISATGLFSAPAVPPANNVLTIKAQSTAYPSSFAQTSLKITRKYPWLWSVYPSSVQVGAYTVSFNGANFAADSVVLANGVAVPTTYVSPTKLVVSGTAAQVGSIQFKVQQPAPGMVIGNSVNLQVVVPTVSIAMTPSTASVALGASRSFSATVTGSANTSVIWSVNGTTGGSPAVGTITSGGLYTAPAVMPAGSTVTVTAAAAASPSTSTSATVTLTVPVVVTVTPGSTTLLLGASQGFSAVVTGSANTAVTWSVNGATGGSPAVGTITSGGVFTAPAAMPAGSTVLVRATAVANGTSYGGAVVTLTSPPPPAVSLANARFLEQTSFGPTPASLAKVQQMGQAAYLEEQFNLPETVIPVPADNSMGTLRQWALHNYTVAPDQLRQRVAYSLGQIIVTSANKLIYADEMIPWMRLLSQHAFGNYRTLLLEVSKSPSMGKYLDLANSVKPGVAGGANENYAREIMQLFTIGLWQLNPDGSTTLDAAGYPIPTYNQATIQQVSLALTGWTYATAPGATSVGLNWEYFGAPMITRAQFHDMGPKTFLGVTIPAGQTVEQDLESVVDTLMNHPNTAPFIATRLIRLMVMSNPSPGYIQRVADVFVNNGSGVRGDLKAVVTAIVMDPEARQDVPTVNGGRLKEPILQASGFLRSLNGYFTSDQQLSYMFDYIAQGVLAPPSVFNWYSPLYHVPKSPLFGPEFQIYTPSEAASRGNLMYHLLTTQGGDSTLDLAPFQPYGNDMPGLVEAANQILLYGRMPEAMKTVLINAAAPGYDAKTRIETVIYLTILSGQYAVQY